MSRGKRRGRRGHGFECQWGRKSFRTWPERGWLLLAGNDGKAHAIPYLFRRVDKWSVEEQLWIPTGQVLEGKQAAVQTNPRVYKRFMDSGPVE